MPFSPYLPFAFRQSRFRYDTRSADSNPVIASSMKPRPHHARVRSISPIDTHAYVLNFARKGYTSAQESASAFSSRWTSRSSASNAVEGPLVPSYLMEAERVRETLQFHLAGR